MCNVKNLSIKPETYTWKKDCRELSKINLSSRGFLVRNKSTDDEIGYKWNKLQKYFRCFLNAF